MYLNIIDKSKNIYLAKHLSVKQVYKFLQSQHYNINYVQLKQNLQTLFCQIIEQKEMHVIDNIFVEIT